MVVSFTQILIWILIAAIVGVLGELIAHRRAPDGIIGAIFLGFLAIVLVVGILQAHIAGEPTLDGVPLITSILVSALLVFIWSGFFYHRYYRPYASRYYYRRGGYVRRPHRRWF
jgi:uncharacterized membrane protein YeaQ/YmgE (transglycosylase-associated protein family)